MTDRSQAAVKEKKAIRIEKTMSAYLQHSHNCWSTIPKTKKVPFISIPEIIFENKVIAKDDSFSYQFFKTTKSPTDI